MARREAGARREGVAVMTYSSPGALLRAAQRCLGGTITHFDGLLVLNTTEIGPDGQVRPLALGPEEAAVKAGLSYHPRARRAAGEKEQDDAA